MAGNIKGIIVEIGGDTSKLQKALNKVNSQSSSLSKELKGINSLLKLDPGNVELLNQKQDVLNKNINTTQDKLQQLQKIKEEADKKMASGGKISEENYRNLQREIITTQNKLNGLTDELKQFNTENSKINKASKKIEEYGNKISKASDKINDLGNKATVVSGAVVAGGVAMVNSAMSVEDAVAKYISSTNTAKNETEKYKKVLENINNANYGEGYEDIANSMSAVKMQLKDIDATSLENITEKAIALRDLFGYEVAESVRAVKALMDHFNISADESFNLIAEGKKQGLDFSNELLDNINEYSVQFKKLGLTAEDMFNIFKVGSQNGAFNLDKIGDAVKEFSIRAIDGSNTTIDGFKRIGLNADVMAKKFANGGETAKQAFIEVVNRLAKMDDKVSQSIAGVDLFGTMWEDLGPTVVGSFSKMDAGISKSSNSMQDSIEELYSTTKNKAETQLKRLQKLGADFGEEMLPVLEKIIDKAEDFIECLEDMSDEEKENVAKIALLTAGFGPLTKVIGTAGSAIGTFAKITNISIDALKTFRTGIESTNSTANTLAKGIGSLTSPVGLTITAITALAGAFVYMNAKTKEIPIALKEATEEMQNYKEEHQNFREEIDKTAASNMAEINNIEKLKNELTTLVDENGKVKEAYKDRASFILKELNNALGTEYTMTGDIINQYKTLQDEIDTLILKKKAQIVLENEEEKYSQALKNKEDAYQTLIETQKAYNEALKGKTYEEYFNDLEQSYLDAGYRAEFASKYAKERMAKWVDGYRQNYEDAKQIHTDYLNDIASYEKDFATVQSGNNEQIEELIRNRTYTYQQSSNDAGETINHNIRQVQYEMQQYQQSYLQDLRNQDTYNAQKNQSQIEAGQKQLDTLVQQLLAMTSTTEEMTPQQLEAWKTLASSSFATYSEYVSKLGPTMQAKIQEATGIVIANTPEFAAQAGKMGEKVTENFDKNAEAKESALKTLQGYYTGLNDNEKKELLKATVGERADEVAKQFESGDYETSGKNVLQGLYNGLNNRTLGQNLISKAASIAKSVAQQFNIEWDEHSPSKLMKKKAEYLLQPIATVFDKEEGKLKNISRSVARSIIEGFDKGGFAKLLNTGNMPNLSNATPNKNINNNNVYNVNIYAQKLDEQKLEQCFNYINKKCGNMYS